MPILIFVIIISFLCFQAAYWGEVLLHLCLSLHVLPGKLDFVHVVHSRPLLAQSKQTSHSGRTGMTTSVDARRSLNGSITADVVGLKN